MCRLVAYLGLEVLLEDVLVRPINSIIMQSLHARESEIPTNGDGFGLGWYAPEIDQTPALFKSISPAWNDNNLLNLTAKIKSPAFFAHVRAASAGGVTHYNCHPFSYGKWMLMHNGEIHSFIKVKRHLRHLLDDDIYNWIQGETDSEHLFALFLQLSKGRDLTKITEVGKILIETFMQISLLIEEFGTPGPSYFNICITDGKRLIASRYCTDKNVPPETMHYSTGERYYIENGHLHMQEVKGKSHSLLVSSEKLTNFNADWHELPKNQLMLVDSDLKIKFLPLP